MSTGSGCVVTIVQKLWARAISGELTLSGDPSNHAPARSIGRWGLLLVVLIAVALCAPLIRTVYWMGDEGVLLHGAERMLQGSTLYVDFFEFLPPGGFVLTAAWLKVVGISFWSARSFAILTIVGIACFTYLACRQASKNAPLSALITIGWVVMSQGIWTQVNHHWITTLFSMIAAWAALTSVDFPQRWQRPLTAGAAAGMAAMVTPTRGALAMLAAIAVFLNIRRYAVELIAYVIGCVLLPAGLFAYVVWTDALDAAFDDVMRFTAERYASIQGVPFGYFADAQNRPLGYLFPLAAVLALVMYVTNWRTCVSDRLLQSCAAFSFAGLVGCFPRPDIVHIAFGAPLACPLLAYCTTYLTQEWHTPYRYMLAAAVIGLCAPSAQSYWWILEKAVLAEFVPTPRGDVAFFGSAAKAPELLKQIAATPSGDAYFFYPYMPLLPFLTARAHVASYDIFMPGYTTPSQYYDACVSVMRYALWIVIDRRWTVSPTTEKRISCDEGRST